MIFDGDNIWIHQSWLDDANRCPESGRLGLLHPEMSGPSDATALGTGAHAACETLLSGGTEADALDALREAIDIEISQSNMRWNKYADRQELIRRATACYHGWRNHILPILPKGTPEVTFRVPLFDLPDGKVVGIEGTADYVPHDVNELWDWKFPGRQYSAKEKQRTALQPSIYVLAAVKGGFSHVTDFEFTLPMKFNYGTVITQVKAARPYVFQVTRNQGHVDFALDRLLAFVDLATNYGLHREWPRNDEHFLCSDKWCPFWSKCKGRRLSWRDDYDVAVEISV